MSVVLIIKCIVKKLLLITTLNELEHCCQSSFSGNGLTSLDAWGGVMWYSYKCKQIRRISNMTSCWRLTRMPVRKTALEKLVTLVMPHSVWLCMHRRPDIYTKIRFSLFVGYHKPATQYVWIGFLWIISPFSNIFGRCYNVPWSCYNLSGHIVTFDFSLLSVKPQSTRMS